MEFRGGTEVRAGRGIDSKHGRDGGIKLAPTCQEICNVGLTDYFRAAQNEIPKRGALVAGKEESLVVDYRAADGAAILIALNRIRSGWRGEEVLSVEDRIAHKLKRVPMETVRAGLGNDIDYAPGVLAILRTVIAGLHAEFLKRVGEG